MEHNHLPGEGPRHEARERALHLLYEADIKKIAYDELVSGLPVAPDPFALSLVRGVASQRERVDHLISQSAVGWEIDRMPLLDVEILRLGAYELLEHHAASVAVIIDEAVELAKEYSTENSAGFVNGVLSTIATRVGR